MIDIPDVVINLQLKHVAVCCGVWYCVVHQSVGDLVNLSVCMYVCMSVDVGDRRADVALSYPSGYSRNGDIPVYVD